MLLSHGVQWHNKLMAESQQWPETVRSPHCSLVCTADVTVFYKFHRKFLSNLCFLYTYIYS